MGSVGLQHTPPIINGQEIHTKSTFSVTNPLTQEEIYTCSSASPEDARAAVKAAHVAFQSWSKTTPSQKRTILNKTADILLSKAAILHDLMSQEVACVASWRNVNIFGSVNMLREAASVVTQIKGEVIPADRPGTMTMIFREPVGVIFSMVPWNAPLNLALRGVCLPLACGNSVILKPSEYTPASQRMLVEIFAEAGLPPGVLQFLPTSPADSPAVAEACIRAKEVRRINFTGSTRVGKIIAKLAAEELKQCIFELGGKASFIVREDANIEDAVNAVIFGGLINSGQVCMSSERVLLHVSIAQEFTERLVTAAKKLKAGNHLNDNSIDIGGLYCISSAKRAMQLIESAESDGAKIPLGDKQITHHTVIGAHILTNVHPEMKIWHEETFAPVLALTTFSTDDEAVVMANDTDTSLCASIFSRDVMKALAMGRKLRTGSTHINGPTIYIEPTLPNGGTGGDSGYGRFGGAAGIKEFTEERIVTFSEPGQKYPLVKS